MNHIPRSPISAIGIRSSNRHQPSASGIPTDQRFSHRTCRTIRLRCPVVVAVNMLAAARIDSILSTLPVLCRRSLLRDAIPLIAAGVAVVFVPAKSVRVSVEDKVLRRGDDDSSRPMREHLDMD